MYSDVHQGLPTSDMQSKRRAYTILETSFAGTRSQLSVEHLPSTAMSEMQVKQKHRQKPILTSTKHPLGQKPRQMSTTAGSNVTCRASQDAPARQTDTSGGGPNSSANLEGSTLPVQGQCISPNVSRDAPEPSSILEPPFLNCQDPSKANSETSIISEEVIKALSTICQANPCHCDYSGDSCLRHQKISGFEPKPQFLALRTKKISPCKDGSLMLRGCPCTSFRSDEDISGEDTGVQVHCIRSFNVPIPVVESCLPEDVCTCFCSQINKGIPIRSAELKMYLVLRQNLADSAEGSQQVHPPVCHSRSSRANGVLGMKCWSPTYQEKQQHLPTSEVQCQEVTVDVKYPAQMCQNLPQTTSVCLTEAAEEGKGTAGHVCNVNQRGGLGREGDTQKLLVSQQCALEAALYGESLSATQAATNTETSMHTQTPQFVATATAGTLLRSAPPGHPNTRDKSQACPLHEECATTPPNDAWMYLDETPLEPRTQMGYLEQPSVSETSCHSHMLHLNKPEPEISNTLRHDDRPKVSFKDTAAHDCKWNMESSVKNQEKVPCDCKPGVSLQGKAYECKKVNIKEKMAYDYRPGGSPQEKIHDCKYNVGSKVNIQENNIYDCKSRVSPQGRTTHDCRYNVGSKVSHRGKMVYNFRSEGSPQEKIKTEKSGNLFCSNQDGSRRVKDLVSWWERRQPHIKLFRIKSSGIKSSAAFHTCCNKQKSQSKPRHECASVLKPTSSFRNRCRSHRKTNFNLTTEGDTDCKDIPVTFPANKSRATANLPLEFLQDLSTNNSQIMPSVNNFTHISLGSVGKPLRHTCRKKKLQFQEEGKRRDRNSPKKRGTCVSELPCFKYLEGQLFSQLETMEMKKKLVSKHSLQCSSRGVPG